MKEQPLISVIVPIYNAETTIRRCVKSIQEQTYDNIQILLVINGDMNDRSLEICQELSGQDRRIRVLQTLKRGVAVARNYGITQATGDYIGFVDSDDWIEPTMYEKLCTALINGKAEISVCRYLREKGSKVQECGENHTGVVTVCDGLRWLISEKIISATWNKLFVRKLFDDIRFPEINIYEDVAVMHQLFAKATQIALICDLEYHYMMHPGSLITKRNFMDRIDAIKIIHQRYDFIKDYFPEICDEMISVIYGAYVTMIVAAIQVSFAERKKQKSVRKELPLMNHDKVLLRKLSKYQRCCLALFSQNCYFTDYVGLALEYVRRRAGKK